MMKKRFWALFLALCMVISVMPTTAFAAWGDNDDDDGRPGQNNNGSSNTNTGYINFTLTNATWNKSITDDIGETELITDNTLQVTTYWYQAGAIHVVAGKGGQEKNGNDENLNETYEGWVLKHGNAIEDLFKNLINGDVSQYIEVPEGYLGYALGNNSWKLAKGGFNYNHQDNATAQMQYIRDASYTIHDFDNTSRVGDTFAQETEYTLTLTPIEYNVVYDLDGGTGDFEDEETYYYSTVKPEDVSGSEVNSIITVSATTEESEKPQKDGYEFLGWDLVTEDGSDIGISREPLSEESVKIDVDDYWNNESIVGNYKLGTGTFTFKAVWKKIENYTVAYDWTGDTYLDVTEPEDDKTYSSVEEAREAVDTNYTSETIVSGRDGYIYTFSGWDNGTLDGSVVKFTGSWEKGDKDPTKWFTVTWVVDDVEQKSQTGLAGTTVEQYTYTPRTGYKFDGWYSDANCTTKVEPANTITENITYYGKTVIDDDSTKTLTYTVEYYKDDTKVTDDTQTVTKTVQILQPDTLTVDKTTINVTDKYIGYRFEKTEPESIPDAIANNGVIKVYYVKDESQTKEVEYTVQHKVDGEVKDSQKYTAKVWVNADAEITIQEGSLAAKTYTGYKYDNNVTHKVGDVINSGTIITLTYSKDNTQTKELSYTVEYYKNNVKVVDDTQIETEAVWINSTQRILTVDATKINTANKYNGYALDYTNPVPIPSTIADKGVIKVYYATDEWKGGDGIPDKYQALVTYKVKGGTWDGSDAADKQEVFTLYTKGTDGVWNAVESAPVLGTTIPDVSKAQPDAAHATPAYWSPTPYADDKVVNGAVYVYTFTEKGDALTFTFDANGGAWTAAVDGYTMGEGNATAEKGGYLFGDVVAKIGTEPVREGYEFLGWYNKNAEGKLTGKRWSFEATKEYIFEDTTVYAKWAELSEEPVAEEKQGNLYVNLQDENGTFLGGTDTPIAVTADYEVAAAGESVDYVYPASVEHNGQTYIYEGPTAYSAALTGTVEKNGQSIVVILQYTLDELDDDGDKPTGGDGTPDKYQALVTYKVVNGTWSDDSSADILKVFTLKTKDAATGMWTDVEGVALGEMPTGMKPAAAYTEKGEWDKTHAAADKPVHGAVYTYTFTTTKAPSVSITKVADDTSVKVGDKVTYTITVKNTGNVDLTNVKITDEFLDGGKGNKKTEGTWSIDTLKPGESIVAKLIYTTVSDDVKGLKNSAVVETNETEDSASTEDVTVTKKNDPVHPVGPSKPQLNKEDHYAYIVGYPDGLVHPEKNITRAEVATIFFRMLLDESREDFWAQENWFFDVMPTDWFNNAVSTLANANLINGYPDGNYRPNANITRAEFATIAIRFFLEEDVEIIENNLSDVKGHWAEANINLAYALNLINGYPDGTFRPDQQITRAEAMTIVNRVLERAPHKDHLLDDMIEWPDNMDEDVWYYADVQEATNSHEFYKTKDKDEDKVHEIWTELLPVRDWVALEQAWSQANSSKNPGEVVDINISTPEASDDTLKLN